MIGQQHMLVITQYLFKKTRSIAVDMTMIATETNSVDRLSSITKAVMGLPKWTASMGRKNAIKRRLLFPVVAATILGLVINMPVLASTTVFERVNYTYANHEENAEDLRVKVLGGDIAVKRYYRVMREGDNMSGRVLGVSGATEGYTGNNLRAPKYDTNGTTYRGVWQFHREWHDLILVRQQNTDTSSSSDSRKLLSFVGETPVEYIDRNDYLYIRVPGQNYFEYEYNGANLRITPTETGYRWSNRQGDYVDYDSTGKAIASGDKNGVQINLVRNLQGLISQYQDHFGNTVLTWNYDTAGRPIQVEDYTGRKVSYSWSGTDLVNVTTSRNHQWTYTYETVSGNRVLRTKTDPEEQTFTYYYQMSEGGYVTVGGNNSSAPDVQLIGNFSNNGGQASFGSQAATQTIAVPSTLMHTAKVYPDGKRKEYQYHYDTNTQAYMLLETNSDGYENERWFDLDGQMRNHLQGGRVTGSRVRSGNTAVSTDSYGNKTTVNYNRWEAVTSMLFADGSQQRYQYHPNYNFVTLATDELGVQTRHEYDDNGNRIRTIAGYETDESRTVEYDYDQYGQVVEIRQIGQANPVGSTVTVTTQFSYDNYGNLIQVIDGNGNKTEYKDYNALGQYQTLIDPRGYTWGYTYDAHGNRLTSTTPLGYITEYTYDTLHRVTQIKDAEGRVSSLAYDSRDNVIQVTQPDGGIRTMTYRVDNLVSSAKDAANLVVNYRYDRAARLTEIVDGVGNQILVDYERGDELAGPRVANVTSPNRRITLTYDSRNRIIGQTQVSVKDDGLTNPTNLQYNARGELVRRTDGNGLVYTYEYNAHRESLSVTNPVGETMRYSYDSRGNLVQVIDALNHLTHYTWDANNNRLSETRPYAPGASATIQTTSYDPADNPLLHTDYNGNIARYQWDNDQRLVQHTDALAGQTTPSRVVSYTYDKTRLITSYDDSHTRAQYRYDANGRLNQQSTTFKALVPFTKTLSMVYYANDQLKQRTDAEYHTTDYSYDGAGKLTRLAIQNAGNILINQYDGLLPTNILYPGGMTRQLEYDGLARLNRILVNDSAGATQMDYGYQFDPVGNITQKATLHGDYSYQYDNAYRLTNAQQPTVFGNQSYSYDANSNRTTLAQNTSDNGITTNKQYTYGYNNQQALNGITKLLDGVESTISQSYDNNGALASDGERSYQYNSFGRLAQVYNGADTIASYHYDPYGRRISKTVAGETIYFLYDKTGLVGEYTESGELIRGYQYYPDSTWTMDPVALKTPEVKANEADPTQYSYSYYYNDHLGAPQYLIQLNGNTVWSGKYDAFGMVYESVTEVENPLRFPGQYFDQETQLHYNWNRYYDPAIGRYISNDPIGLNGGSNVYAYVAGNPLLYVDYNGLCLSPAWIGAISGAVGGAITGASGGLPGIFAGAAVGAAAGAFTAGTNAGYTSKVATGAVAGGLSASFSGKKGTFTLNKPTVAGVAAGIVGGAAGAGLGVGDHELSNTFAGGLGGATGAVAAGAFGATKSPEVLPSIGKGFGLGLLGGAAQSAIQSGLENAFGCNSGGVCQVY